ncbi:MAG: hypothetical protein ABS81_15495 [Pseudonocardia sp. SCN 72-86]|nr:MAG: hypothetical protein ABS81_15495 [Pseudonocardia sp. SCN 72-86]
MSDDPIDTTHDGGGTDLFDPATFQDAGVPDVYETFPTDGSGIHDDTALADTAEPLVQIAPGVDGRLLDTNSDGTPDAVAVDLDGDGDLDATITRDPAGTFTIGYDDDGDGLADRYETVTKAQLDAVLPGVAAALDPAGTQHGPPADTAPPVEDGRVVGDPEEYSHVWFQQAVNGFCMPSSVAQIISVYTGETMTDEMQVVQAANQLQLWSVGGDGVPGMTSENAVTLLEAYGIPVELTHELIGDHALEALDQALADGRGVIITIDSGEVWYGEKTEDHMLDHAVVVAGIDYDRGVVLLSDPGNPNGNLEEVPIDVFMDAWADSRYEMITCDEPAAALTDGPGGADGGAAASGLGLDAVFTRPWAMLPVTVSMSGPGA